MRNSAPLGGLAAIVLAFGSASAAHAGVTTYALQELPVPAGVNAVALSSLNNNAAAVGNFFNAGNFSFDAVAWDPSGNLTTFSAGFGFAEASATTIRDDGTILGGGTLDFSEVSHAFVIDPAGNVDSLPSLAPDDGVRSVAFDQTDVGRIVGRSATLPSPFMNVPEDAVYWENGQITSIGTLPGGDVAEARRINNNGIIIGMSNNAQSTVQRGFVWDETNGIRELQSAVAGAGTAAEDLNESNLIVGGTPVPAGGGFAAMWAGPDASPQVLPILGNEIGSLALGVNELGDIVGFLDTGQGTRGALWSDGQVFDLNDLVPHLDFEIREAVDINDNGQILVAGFDTDTSTFRHAVLTPIPAPGAALVVAVGIGLCGRRSRRRSVA